MVRSLVRTYRHALYCIEKLGSVDSENVRVVLRNHIAVFRIFSNDQAAELVRSFATPRLKRLMLAHLSEECNAAHLAESTMREALASAGLGHVELSIIQ